MGIQIMSLPLRRTVLGAAREGRGASNACGQAGKTAGHAAALILDETPVPPAKRGHHSLQRALRRPLAGGRLGWSAAAGFIRPGVQSVRHLAPAQCTAWSCSPGGADNRHGLVCSTSIGVAVGIEVPVAARSP